MWYPDKIEKKVVAQSYTTTIVVSSLSLVLLVFVGISGYLFIRNQKLKRFLTDEEVKEFLNGKKRLEKLVKEEENADCEVEYMKFNNEYELPKIELDIGT